MTINTNGWTIYAQEGITLSEIINEFETNEDLWSKADGPTKLGPRGWVLAHGPNDIRYTTGRSKEKIKQRLTMKIVCECGRTIAKGELSRHRKTKVHLQDLEA